MPAPQRTEMLSKGWELSEGGRYFFQDWVKPVFLDNLKK